MKKIINPDRPFIKQIRAHLAKQEIEDLNTLKFDAAPSTRRDVRFTPERREQRSVLTFNPFATLLGK